MAEWLATKGYFLLVVPIETDKGIGRMMKEV